MPVAISVTGPAIMSDLVVRARNYAAQAHERIDHRRKYSDQPYLVHLEAVAQLVETATDDQEMIAAAWLHDTVEDTPATLEDIEEQFGAAVAELVEELTDVSRPGDGNRAVRKEIDRRHTAQASARAKTIKLCDLIDNCRDITEHDPRFARVYLAEMGALLDVLKGADGGLQQQAREIHTQSMNKLGLLQVQNAEESTPYNGLTAMPGLLSKQFRQMFGELFSARDIAEPLLSFDKDSSCEEVCRAMEYHQGDVASVRVSGRVQGYLCHSWLGKGDCADHFRTFTVDQVVLGEAPLSDVIHVLTRHDFCFVSLVGEVTGVIGRDDINKPMVRMWLFGMITMLESGMAQMIELSMPQEQWMNVLSPGRLEKALAIQAERQRRNQHCSLLSCLQLSDKGQVLMSDPDSLALLGFESRRTARRVVRQLESLRNNLAHTQDIVTHDWAQIARMTQRLDEITRS
jgi:hypothetical protein